MRSYDHLILGLTGKIKHHLSHTCSEDNQRRNATELAREYNKCTKFPLIEVSSAVWDEMDYLANQALITNRNI